MKDINLEIHEDGNDLQRAVELPPWLRVKEEVLKRDAIQDKKISFLTDVSSQPTPEQATADSDYNEYLFSQHPDEEPTTQKGKELCIGGMFKWQRKRCHVPVNPKTLDSKRSDRSNKKLKEAADTGIMPVALINDASTKYTATFVVSDEDKDTILESSEYQIPERTLYENEEISLDKAYNMEPIIDDEDEHIESDQALVERNPTTHGLSSSLGSDCAGINSDTDSWSSEFQNGDTHISQKKRRQCKRLAIANFAFLALLAAFATTMYVRQQKKNTPITAVKGNKDLDQNSQRCRRSDACQPVAELLSQVTPLELLQDPVSPQGRAMEWLIGSPREKLSDEPENNGYAVIERYVLATLYFATSGHVEGTTWKEDSLWLSQSPICDWHGVSCGSDSFDGETWIQDISLSRNDLQGRIPDEMRLLIEVEKLDLSRNKLTGPIPGEIGQLQGLIELNLSNNKLDGNIPEGVGRLSELRELDLSSNALVGSIPQDFIGLTLVERLRLNDNDLDGKLPHWIEILDSLEALYLDHNAFSSSIPEELGEMTGLEEVSLHSNRLDGSVPESLCEMKLTLLTADCAGDLPPVSCSCCDCPN